MMGGELDMRKMGILIGVALECVEEDRESRPTMSQILEKACVTKLDAHPQKRRRFCLSGPNKKTTSYISPDGLVFVT